MQHKKQDQERKIGINNKGSKAVLQFDLSGNLIKEYYSRKRAQRETGVRQSGISHCCKGNNKTSGDFKWKFK